MKGIGSNRKVKEAIRQMAGTFNKDFPQLFFCSVSSVDLDNRTCDCLVISDDVENTIPDVLLLADPTDGVLISPKIDSTVVVAFTSRNEPFVLMFSDIDSIETIIGETTFKIENGKITLNDGSFDGLVKVVELVERMNIIEERINSLQTTLKTHTHPGVTSGSSATSPSADFGTFTDLTETTKSNLENTKIVHGV